MIESYKYLIIFTAVGLLSSCSLVPNKHMNSEIINSSRACNGGNLLSYEVTTLEKQSKTVCNSKEIL